MRLLVYASFGGLLLTISPASAQTTIYRETFGRPATDPQPDEDLLGNITGNIFDWPTFRATFAGGNAELQLLGLNTSGVSGNAAAGQPTDVANINAGHNSDGTDAAYPRGIYFMSQAAPDQAPKLAWTSEFSFDPANYTSLTFNWRQGNDSDFNPFQVAVRIADQWYVSTTEFFTVGYPDGIANFNASAQPQSLLFDPAAANWLTLDFDGTWDAAANTGTDSTLPLAVGGNPVADLSGAIDGFGLYNPLNTGTRRFDTFEIRGQLIGGGRPGDFDGDSDVDGEDFLSWQRGESPNAGNAADFTDWQNNFGEAAVGPVPEPAALVLILLPVAMLAFRTFTSQQTFR